MIKLKETEKLNLKYIVLAFQALGAEEISKSNPVVVAEKVAKI